MAKWISSESWMGDAAAAAAAASDFIAATAARELALRPLNVRTSMVHT